MSTMKRNAVRLISILLALLCLFTTSLADLKFPAALQVIEPYAFYGDDSLTTVTLPEGIKEIRAMAFANSSLREINLPSSLTFIATNAFNGCENLHVTVPDNSYALVWAKGKQTIPYTIEEGYTSQYGSVIGSIVDTDNSGVAGVTVSLYQNNRRVNQTVTDADGSYVFTDVPEGTYKILASRNGYVDFSNIIDVYGGETTYTESAGAIAGTTGQTGTVSGRVTNAFTGKGIANAVVTVRSGWGNQGEGSVVATLTTDSNGNYSADLPIGYYTITVSENGYTLSSSNIYAQAGVAVDSQNLAVVPQAADDEYRIKLSWDADPRDLDSHLVGSMMSGASYHVFYSSKQASEGGKVICNLDVDDTDGYGPEVVTVLTQTNEPYYYYVHHFAGDGTIATSSARVEVYKGGTLLRTYIVPSSAGAGKYWNVFCIQNGKIYTRNTMTDAPETSYRGGEENPDEIPTLTWSDGTVTRDEVEVPRKGYFYSFSFISEKPWSITAPSWVELSSKSGKAGRQSVFAQIRANEGPQREGDMFISSPGCEPLMVHFTQEAGDAELEFSVFYEGPMVSTGKTHGTGTISVKDSKDDVMFQAENVSLKATLPSDMYSAELSKEHVITLISEGYPRTLDFDLELPPSPTQLNQIAQQDEVQSRRVKLKMDITTGNCGDYEYTMTFDATPTTTKSESFNMYLADYLMTRSTLYDDIRTYTPAYRTMVQPLMESDYFQVALLTWRTYTFNVTSEVKYAEKELDYYRAYIYTILYDEVGEEPFMENLNDVYELVDDINDFYKTYSKYDNDIGSIREMLFDVKGDKWDAYNNGVLKFFKDVKEINDDPRYILAENYKKWIPVAEALDTVSAVSSFIKHVGTFMNFLERAQELRAFTEITTQKRKILQGIAAQQPNNLALQAAIDEYLEIYPAVDDKVTLAIMAGEETLYTMLKTAGTKAYLKFVAAAPWIALTQLGSQGAANFFFDTTDIISAYYNCEAAIKMEDGLDEELTAAWNNYVLNHTEENAIQFLATVDAFYRNRVAGLQAADKFAETVLTDEGTGNFLLDTCLMPLSVLKSAIDTAFGTDKSKSYPQIKADIDNQITHCKAFMASERKAAVYMYYDASRLIEVEEKLERVD